jgi:GT2 family glycosyltransferase
MTAPTLSVIIVTWNVRDLTLACLAVLQRELHEIPSEVIVVDNASGDGTVEAVRAAYPETRIVANRANMGYPAANNQGVAAARGDYVLFLNPDTEPGPGSVAACLSALEADAAVGVAGCRLELEDGSVQLECARHPYLLRHLAMELLYLHMLFPRSRIFGDHLMGYWDHRGERDVEAICGAFMMARRSVVEQVGGLPSDVFMYHEDLAFCLRVRRAGWRIRYLGEHVTLHRWRGSSSKSDAKLALLEGQYKLQLIRDAQGSLSAAVGRVLFAVRCASRLPRRWCRNADPGSYPRGRAVSARPRVAYPRPPAHMGRGPGSGIPLVPRAPDLADTGCAAAPAAAAGARSGGMS